MGNLVPRNPNNIHAFKFLSGSVPGPGLRGNQDIELGLVNERLCLAALLMQHGF